MNKKIFVLLTGLLLTSCTSNSISSSVQESSYSDQEYINALEIQVNRISLNSSSMFNTFRGSYDMIPGHFHGTIVFNTVDVKNNNFILDIQFKYDSKFISSIESVDLFLTNSYASKYQDLTSVNPKENYVQFSLMEYMDSYNQFYESQKTERNDNYPIYFVISTNVIFSNERSGDYNFSVIIDENYSHHIYYKNLLIK